MVSHLISIGRTAFLEFQDDTITVNVSNPLVIVLSGSPNSMMSFKINPSTIVKKIILERVSNTPILNLGEVFIEFPKMKKIPDDIKAYLAGHWKELLNVWSDPPYDSTLRDALIYSPSNNISITPIGGVLKIESISTKFNLKISPGPKEIRPVVVDKGKRFSLISYDLV